jgi:glycosyltransferase involved in cell wall biosynthesis
MRLVFLIDNYKRIGGGTYSQFCFAKYMALRGHEVVVFAGDRNFLSQDLLVPGLTVKYRRSVPEIFGLGKRRSNAIIMQIHQWLVIEPFLREFKPDWLIGYMRISAIKAAKLGRKYSIPVANFVFETPPWIESVMKIKLSPALQKSWAQTRKAYSKSDILIPNSDLSGKQLKSWLPEANVSMPVYPGAEIHHRNDKEMDQRLYDIIYVGRLQKHKNLDLLLNAADPQHKIIIIGSGPEEDTLRKIAVSRNLDVDFAGAVSDREKWDALINSKLMVFPSSFEGFGVPPLEALASGCHVLCSDIPILREVYGDQVDYFSLDQPEKLKIHINNLLGKGKLAGRSPLLSKYTWESASERIEQILNTHSP